MDEASVLELITRIEDEYDVNIQNPDRWVRALDDQDGWAITQALDRWMASDYGFKPPAPADLKRLVGVHAPGSTGRAGGKGPAFSSGVDANGDMTYYDGGWWLIPKDQITAAHIAKCKAAMVREGTYNSS